jgi:hypothetical protein
MLSEMQFVAVPRSVDRRAASADARNRVVVVVAGRAVGVARPAHDAVVDTRELRCARPDHRAAKVDDVHVAVALLRNERKARVELVLDQGRLE